MADDFDSLQGMFENLTNAVLELRGCAVFNNGRKIMFTTLDKNSSPNHHSTFLPGGTMVPAYGKITLLEGLERLGDRVAMCK